MNVDDSKILEMIERLAREAGARSSETVRVPIMAWEKIEPELQPEPVKPEPVPEALKLTVRYLLETIIATTDDSMTYYTLADGKTLTYGDIRSLKPWLEKQAT